MEKHLSYKIFHEDCRIGLQQITDNSVDFIITDPPYFIDGMDDGWNDRRLNNRAAKAGIVGGLPVGMKFDSMQGKRLQNFLEPLAAEFLRVLKPGAFCIVFSQGRLYHRTACALDNAGFEIRDMLGWKYEGQAKAFSQNHFIRKNKRLSEAKKLQLIAELDGLKTPQLKPQIEPMSLAQKPREGTFVENWQKYKVGLMDSRESLDHRFPGTIIEISKHGKNTEKIAHMTIKPVPLIAHLIRLFTRPGQIVLDPFLGSGTHAVAALENSRNFIGFEIEEKYYNFAKTRLRKVSAAQKQNNETSLQAKSKNPALETERSAQFL